MRDALPSKFREIVLKGDLTGADLDVAGTTDAQCCRALEYAAETRRFEIERFGQRSAFFWAFTAALFAAYGFAKGDWHLQVGVSCFGLLSGEAWTLQNRGARYWHEAWERKVHLLEERALGANLFSNKEKVEFKGWFGASRFSVSKLAIMFSDGCVVAWTLPLPASSNGASTWITVTGWWRWRLRQPPWPPR